MSEHYIKEIEIKNYKLFKDFKASGFGRVNLIGGKNNVGKTAFLEAQYLINNAYEYELNNPKDENRERRYFEIIKSLINIEFNRKMSESIIKWFKDEFFFEIDNFDISIPKKFRLACEENFIMPERLNDNWNYGNFNINNFRNNKYFYTIYKKSNLPNIKNPFITPCYKTHLQLTDMLDNIKLEGDLDHINKILNKLFNIKSIDVIKNKLMLKTDKYRDINEYGDGIKSFIHIILFITSNKNTVVYIDEIENGIHYSMLDELWQYIFIVSEINNVQVMATSHSIECIKSFNIVNNDISIMEDNENIAFYFEMIKNIKNKKIYMRKLDNEQLEYELTHDGEFRG